MIVNSVINLSHDEKSVRFNVKVGVAYGSDTKLVESLLLKAAGEQKDILNRPEPQVIFNDFADSSLEFILYFYSNTIFNSELVRSELRFNTNEKFSNNGISIPFPQRDVWMINQ
jgi:small-conductance mechanosensitive channel